MSVTLEELVQQIKDCRSVSSDGKSVIYDLTKGVDFSKPEDTAQALSAVFFINEASHWFTKTGGEYTFTPTCTVEMKFRNTHSAAMNKFLRRFMGDVKNNDLGELYTAYTAQSIGGIFAGARAITPFSGLLGSSAPRLIQMEDMQNDALLHQMMTDIQKNLQITEIEGD